MPTSAERGLEHNESSEAMLSVDCYRGISIAIIGVYSKAPGAVDAMAKTRLADTPRVIGRLQGADPPVLAQEFLGDTEIALPWPQQPHNTYCPPMRHHIIGGVFRGDGTTAVKVGGKQLRVHSEAGTVIINPRGTDGWWDCSGSPLVSNVFLGQERLQRCADEIGQGHRPELLLSLQIHDPKLFRLLELIAEESLVKDTVSKLYVEHLVDALCLQVLRSHSAFPLAETIHRGGLSPPQVRRVKAFMQDNLAREITVQELADLVSRSRFHFCRAFRQTTGYTPHQALIHLRLQRACELLSDRTLSVTDVALAVGYQSSSAFALAFRRGIGETPSAYRARL
jgi:AraC-like DNA-binding protein